MRLPAPPVHPHDRKGLSFFCSASTLVFPACRLEVHTLGLLLRPRPLATSIWFLSLQSSNSTSESAMKARTATVCLFVLTGVIALLYSPLGSWVFTDTTASSVADSPVMSGEGISDLGELRGVVDSFEDELKKGEAEKNVRPQTTDNSIEKWEANKPKAPLDSALWRLTFAIQDTTVAQLAYSKALNPRWRPLTDSQWDSLDRLYEPYRLHLRTVAIYRGQTLSRELDSLQEQGQLRESIPAEEVQEAVQREATKLATAENLARARRGVAGRVSAQDYLEIASRQGSPDLVELGYTRRTVGGKAYYFRTRDSKSYRAATAYYAHRAQETAFLVITWFQENGFLTFEEASSCANQVMDSATSAYQGG